MKESRILEKIREVGERCGFRRFNIIIGGDTFGVGKQYSDGKFVGVENGTLYIGSNKIGYLEEVARTDVELAEKGVEQSILHEAGYIHRPKKQVKVKGKTVPYSLDEIINSQLRKGMEPSSSKAESPREAQANLYATVKYHEDKDVGGLMDGIAAKIWHTLVFHTFATTGIYFPGESIQCHVREFVGECYPWLKTDAIEKIADKIVNIDKNYKSKLAEAGK